MGASCRSPPKPSSPSSTRRTRRPSSRIAQRGVRRASQASALTVPKLLMLALKNELEATECAAAWIGTTRRGRREARARAASWRRGEALSTDPGAPRGARRRHRRAPTRSRPAGARSSTWLLALEGTVARVAAGQFTREALAVVRNAEFITYCRATGDDDDRPPLRGDDPARREAPPRARTTLSPRARHDRRGAGRGPRGEPRRS